MSSNSHDITSSRPSNNVTMPTMPQQLDIIDGLRDDISIVQGLLAPRIPRRTASLASLSTGGQVDDSKKRTDATESSDSNPERRRGLQSSNTWTSSSGDVLSDHDDIEDRSFYIQEFNRLARKVTSNVERSSTRLTLD